MVNIRAVDELAQKLADLVPPGLSEAEHDLKSTFRAALQAGLSRLNLVTREEFDVQKLVLLRTREKVEALERQVADIESKLQPKH